MNTKNLSVKFACVAVLVAVCLWSLYTKGTQQGIDLRGGHSLIFAIRSPQAEAEQMQAEADELQEQRKAAEAAGEKGKVKELDGRIARLNEEIRVKREQGGGEDISKRMIEILKERIDPQGLANLEWRSVGKDRIEVRMPAGRQDTQLKRKAYDDAVEALERGNVSSDRKNAYLKSSAAERETMRGQFKDGQVRQALKELGEASDKMQAAAKVLADARASGDRAKTDAAANDHQNAWHAFRLTEQALKGTRVSSGRLGSILRNYRTPEEAVALKDKERDALAGQLAADLKALGVKHSDRKADVDAVVESYKAWANVRHRLSDPSDLQRRIARAGVLEFRIVAGYRGVDIERDLQDTYVKLLEEEGPEEVRRRGRPYAWFPIREDDRKTFSSMIMAEYAGQSYVLLCNQDDYQMLREPGAGGWRLTGAFRDTDQYGRPSIGFRFDETGAQKFFKLTSTHKGKAMAILLDDEVFSAPNIESAISDRGQITGKFTESQVKENVRLLEAGSLPARLNPEPVAVRSFGPTLGAENREKGKWAAYAGLICVALFMLAYYRLPGLIADVALVLNVILVLGAMSLLNAVFTLPGIAGIVLTIGIAVDANVLIFERLREEQAKVQSVRIALRNAYDRAFTAIFDANITTLITCLILGWVGTVEVRGFAITLGLGVTFSMFTALVVTRWIFQVLLDTNIIKSPLGMTSIIGVPKVSWMAKRKLFWAVSLVMIVLGVMSLAWQGGEIWGIEFSSGTQAVVQFTDDALIGEAKDLPNDERVRKLFSAQAAAGGSDTLRDPRVETLLDPDRVAKFLRNYDENGDSKVALAEAKAAKLSEAFFAKINGNTDEFLDRDELDESLPAVRYQISTTETDLKLIQGVARKAFGASLARRTACAFEPAAGKKIPELGLACDEEGTARIEAAGGSAYNDVLEDYVGGVAVVVQNVSPAISEGQLEERILAIRSQDAGGGAEMYTTDVIGLGQRVEGGYASFAVLVKLDEVVASRWNSAAARQVQLVSDALSREELIEATVFDAAIAGQAAQWAIMAIVLSWIAIVLYLWLRFGRIQWGLAAVICLVHDVIIVVGLVAATGWIYNTFLGPLLGIAWFKIDLAMIAAFLTVIGYSVNDTIVVFDRIRENRGKLTTVSAGVIDTSVNQMLARTLLTSGTTFIVVFIMYVWGGQGVKSFNYALLMGIVFGTYSSVAIASPLLMGFREALAARAAKAAPAA